MTGFARSSVTVGPRTVTVELRSVNSRFLDLHFKLPESLRSVEPELRRQLSQSLSRGKVELMVRISQDQGGRVGVDAERLQSLLSALDSVSEKLDQAAPIDPLSLLLAPGVLGDAEQDDEAVANSVPAAANEALKELKEQRRREGEAMAALVTERADNMRQMLAALREQLPALREVQRQRILDRISSAGVEADGKRLEEELVYVAQRADVDEEMDRIDAHLDAIAEALTSGKPCGRRLDFLMQELNREANTLSSKSTALTTTNTAVEFKLLIEQMREQIQNIE
jgi:uncharacterized protein (TIGR00255 family)